MLTFLKHRPIWYLEMVCMDWTNQQLTRCVVLLRACFKKNSFLQNNTFSNKFSGCPIFLPKKFLFIPQNFYDLFLVIDHKLCYICTRNIQMTFFTLLPLTLDSSYPRNFFFSIHHCKNSHSSLHIFVHHCTFCASLHANTSPGFTSILLASHSLFFV